jgi:hypothetical protein
MVREEAERLCAAQGGLPGVSKPSFPCPQHLEIAESFIPPVDAQAVYDATTERGMREDAARGEGKLVSAEEYDRQFAVPPELEGAHHAFGYRVLATLRHYEAEVGRLNCRVADLGAELREAGKCVWALEADLSGADRVIEFTEEDGTERRIVYVEGNGETGHPNEWKIDDDEWEKLTAQLAREAPFAALGRAIASDPTAVWAVPAKYESSWTSARAALAKEAEPVEQVNPATGTKFRVKDGVVEQLTQYRNALAPVWERCRFVEEAAFVARLLEGGKDGE